ncbi:glycosyltransferase [Mycoplasmopsis lipophila]|uniref:glycosyltransferase n=1 Tax=Mycoplasmopsis lipophila TaxID=2117 RepID=UPI0038731459
MKISIISPIVNNDKELKEFLSGMYYQNNQDFEVILVFNNMTKKMYATIESYLDFFGSRLKFIINSNKQTLQDNIIAAWKIISGEYFNILFSNNTIRYYFLNSMKNLVNLYNTDVIEFKPRLVGSIRWKPLTRLEPMKKFNFKEDTSFLAYAYPFISNKLFKKSLVENLLKYQPTFSNDYNFAIELNYLLLMNANTYAYNDQRIIREYINYVSWMNPKNFINQFKKIIEMGKTKETKITQELEYAKNYFFQVILAGILGLSTFISKDEYKEKKSYHLIEQLDMLIDKEIENNEKFYNTNIYMHKENKEIKFLREKQPIKKWNELLSSLE